MYSYVCYSFTLLLLILQWIGDILNAAKYIGYFLFKKNSGFRSIHKRTEIHESETVGNI